MENMSKHRQIDTRFWSDSFIVELDPLDRYLFLYLLTNEHNNIAGIYELPLRTMAYETGLEPEMLKMMIKRLEEKVVYFEGWVFLKNFIKHQNIESDTVKIGIRDNFALVPEKVIRYICPIHTISIPYNILILIPILKLILKLKSKSILKEKTESRFAPPSLEEIKTYCIERKNGIDPNQFIDFYSSKGWLIGKNKMKDWKAAVRTWEGRDKKENPSSPALKNLAEILKDKGVTK